MGCIARLGCLVILVLLGALAWLTRDRWTPYLHRGHPAVAEAPIHWQPLTPEGARRAQAALDTLSQVQGPVFQNVAAGDAAAYVMKALLGRMPQPADSAAAATRDGDLLVRADVALRDLGGTAVLGPLASMLGERERMEMAGTFRVVHPGLTEFRVTQVKLGRISVPGPVIPKLLARVARGAGLDSVRADALPIPTPKYMVDVRVADGHLTLYKGTR
ncbi:MAG: hypothetical protein KGL93_00540 [Gemmatimonadota bacterium]|nr:hypothetical protein [Gemmatimonadota bacterium]